MLCELKINTTKIYSLGEYFFCRKKFFKAFILTFSRAICKLNEAKFLKVNLKAGFAFQKCFFGIFLKCIII